MGYKKLAQAMLLRHVSCMRTDLERERMHTALWVFISACGSRQLPFPECSPLFEFVAIVLALVFAVMGVVWLVWERRAFYETLPNNSGEGLLPARRVRSSNSYRT